MISERRECDDYGLLILIVYNPFATVTITSLQVRTKEADNQEHMRVDKLFRTQKLKSGRTNFIVFN